MFDIDQGMEQSANEIAEFLMNGIDQLEQENAALKAKITEIEKVAVFAANEMSRRDYSIFVLTRGGNGDIGDIKEYAKLQSIIPTLNEPNLSESPISSKEPK